MVDSLLDGIRVVELADERAEYAGLLLAGMGAEVIKIEPKAGSPTRKIGPFYEDIEEPDRSLYFWQYNRGKRSIALDLDQRTGRDRLLDLLRTADVFLDSSDPGHLDALGLSTDELRRQFPSLIVSRLSPFGDQGPWARYKGSDLIHLALGGQTMCCGYGPRPDGSYDLPPIAPQMWHAYHVAGEQLVTGLLAALFHRHRTGEGQAVSVAVHEAVAKNTELDVMNWVMLRQPIYRQTCEHARGRVSPIPPVISTKDGRWFMVSLMWPRDRPRIAKLLARYAIANELDESESPETTARAIPGATVASEGQMRAIELLQRLFRRFTFAEAPWREAQECGIMVAPIRKPDENLHDEHWRIRGTYTDIEHPEFGRSFTYPTSKWISTETDWLAGRRAPVVDEDRAQVLSEASLGRRPPLQVTERWKPASLSPLGKPLALDGIRVFDFSWFLASAGGTRLLAALGAEVIKVEWSAHPDTRIAVMAPVGGREARDRTTQPLKGVTDPDMGGQFNNKNPGKRGISLNVRHPKGLEIARDLIGMSDIVAEGFSPGVLDSWGLSYEALKQIKPDIIYAQQSGMGTRGSYGRYRAVGPIAASLAGTTEMSGLPEPVMPAGWGYSYLDWIAAYSFANSMIAALLYRERTGKGQWIEASQTETGIFIGGTAALQHSANGKSWERYGNRSPWKKAAPHGIYRCAGDDRWIAIACFTDAEWIALTQAAHHPEWATDTRFSSLTVRLANQDALDELVTSWTQTQDSYDLMDGLQGLGVPAGVCQNAQDKCEHDPQLKALGWLREVTGTKIGTWPLYETPIDMELTPTYIGGQVDRGAPIYAEDNEYVYGDLLGMSSSDIEQLVEDGVIEMGVNKS